MFRQIVLIVFFIIFILIIKELFWKSRKSKFSINGQPKLKKDKKKDEQDIIEIDYKEIKK